MQKTLFHITMMAGFTALFLYAGMVQAQSLEKVRSGVVSRVVDGDTVWIKADGELLKVRIRGIDAPEICQAGGIEAREALRRRVGEKTVTFIYQRRDDYQRLLAQLELDGENIARSMVRQGHAWSYGYRRDTGGPYAAEQAQAMASRQGVFAQDRPENPRTFRRRHGSCFP